MVISVHFGQPAAPPHVVVNGEGVVKATPNQAWISIGVETRSKQSNDAQARNAQAMSAVQQKIASLGIASEAIKTTAIDLQLEFDYADGKQTLRGYVARNMIEVRVDELSGRPIAILYNYACHTVTMGPKCLKLSPDFIGPARETIESSTGALSLFLQGAAGSSRVATASSTARPPSARTR